MTDKIIKYLKVGTDHGDDIFDKYKGETIDKYKGETIDAYIFEGEIFVLIDDDGCIEIFVLIDDGGCMVNKSFNLEYIITRRKFIEAISSKLESIDEQLELDSLAWECSSIDKLTYHQAIAIRDGKLEEFITEILKNV